MHHTLNYWSKSLKGLNIEKVIFFLKYDQDIKFYLKVVKLLNIGNSNEI